MYTEKNIKIFSNFYLPISVIKITNKEKVIHKYIVKQMKIVNPYDAWVIEEADTELLTLFTCANKGTKRFVVKCVPEKNYFSEGSDANATSVQTE